MLAVMDSLPDPSSNFVLESCNSAILSEEENKTLTSIEKLYTDAVKESGQSEKDFAKGISTPTFEGHPGLLAKAYHISTCGLINALGLYLSLILSSSQTPKYTPIPAITALGATALGALFRNSQQSKHRQTVENLNQKLPSSHSRLRNAVKLEESKLLSGPAHMITAYKTTLAIAGLPFLAFMDTEPVNALIASMPTLLGSLLVALPLIHNCFQNGQFLSQWMNPPKARKL